MVVGKPDIFFQGLFIQRLPGGGQQRQRCHARLLRQLLAGVTQSGQALLHGPVNTQQQPGVVFRCAGCLVQRIKQGDTFFITQQGHDIQRLRLAWHAGDLCLPLDNHLAGRCFQPLQDAVGIGGVKTGRQRLAYAVAQLLAIKASVHGAGYCSAIMRCNGGHIGRQHIDKNRQGFQLPVNSGDGQQSVHRVGIGMGTDA